MSGVQLFLVLFSATRIKNLTGVSIRIPPDNSKDDIIRIEGSPEGVARAKQELIDLVEKMVMYSFPPGLLTSWTISELSNSLLFGYLYLFCGMRSLLQLHSNVSCQRREMSIDDNYWL
jgi:hypothetical protein